MLTLRVQNIALLRFVDDLVLVHWLLFPIFFIVEYAEGGQDFLLKIALSEFIEAKLGLERKVNLGFLGKQMVDYLDYRVVESERQRVLVATE